MREEIPSSDVHDGSIFTGRLCGYRPVRDTRILDDFCDYFGNFGIVSGRSCYDELLSRPTKAYRPSDSGLRGPTGQICSNARTISGIASQSPENYSSDSHSGYTISRSVV
eukprot:1009696_1